MFKLLPLLFKNIFRKKTRSILTMASIILPLFIICILSTLLKAMEQDPSKGRGLYRVAVRHKVSLAQNLPESYGPKLITQPGVVAMTTLNWFGGKYIDNTPQNFFTRFAVDANTLLDVFDEIEIVQGSADAWVSTRDSVLVPQSFLKKYNWKLGDRITLLGDIYPIDLNLVILAAYKAPQEDAVYFHWNYIDQALPNRRGIGMYWLKTDSVQTVNRLTRDVDLFFENTPFPTKTESEKEFMNGFLSMLGNIKLLINSMGTIMIIVILLIASNTMSMSARERVTEIAVLRCLGFQKRTILWMILGESVVLSLMGGCLGLLLSYIAIPSFRNFLLATPGPLQTWGPFVTLYPQTLVLAFSITFLLGVMAGFIPAILSANRSIVEGLRQVG